MGYQFGKQGNNLKEYVGEFFFKLMPWNSLDRLYSPEPVILYHILSLFKK